MLHLKNVVNNKAGGGFMSLLPQPIEIWSRLEQLVDLTHMSVLQNCRGASVPFKMLTYGVVFSEDAFALEAKMHKTFQ